MIKKCIGCGVIMQNTKKDAAGYTPNMENTYCMRCFRLKNYGEKKLEVISNKEQENIIKKVNNKNALVFFLIDYFSLCKENIDIFKKINIPKILIVSKCDVIRKEIKQSRIKNWLKKVYNISDEVLFLSSKDNNLNINTFNYLDKYGFNTLYIMGITNAGKSTFLNKILKKNNIKKEILVSDKPNTTLDFIKIHIDNYIIIDTPGFNNERNIISINKEIKPITYNITKPVNIIIGEYIFYFDFLGSITINSVIDVKRDYKKYSLNQEINIKSNSDLVIPGIGFINIKNEGKIFSNINNFEVRPSITGEDYE